MTTLGTRTFHWQLDESGRSHQFRDTQKGVDCLATPGAPMARLLRGEDTVLPESLRQADDRLHLRFTDGSSLQLAVERADTYLVLTVVECEAAPFDKLEFVDVDLEIEISTTPESFSVCAVARNLRTRVDELPGPQPRLGAACYPAFGIEGASVAIIAAPFGQLRASLQTVVSGAPELPHSPLGGPWALDAPENRNSYLFGVATEETVDDWIGLCHDFGLGQLHLCGGGAFRMGDYRPNPEMYPDGVDSVRRVIERLHGAGLQAGLHTMSFSIAKNAGYVSPVPDPRLGADNTFTLATDLRAEDTTVAVTTATDHMPLRTSYHIRQSMTLMVDDELIDYRGVQATAPYGLTGCARGVCGTTPARHRAGATVRHLKACWGLFAPDGESSLFEEIAANIAGLINAADFDMVYLDGLDGIHVLDGERGRWHYGGRFAFEVFRRLERPIVMEMAAFLHHLWFVRSRMGAWDHAIRGHKTFIDMHARSNANFARIFLPAHLGWWSPKIATNAKEETAYADDIAYLCTRALGAGIGFSLQGVTPDSVRRSPHLTRMASVFRTHEELRRAGSVPESVRAQLAIPGREFALEKDAGGEAHFRPVCRSVHKADAGTSTTWAVLNAHDEQTPSVRIEALWSAADYDSPEAVTLAEFVDAGEFDDSGQLQAILNSGKDFTYPGAAPGMSATLTPVAAGGPSGGPCAELVARRAATEATVLTSSPADDFSVHDHGERFHTPRIASWIRLGKNFSHELDLTGQQALGCWVHGDGSGALLNLQVRSTGRFFSLSDHYVILDFEGWRYVELIEPESDRHRQYSWPYARAVYKVHRHGVEYDCVTSLHLWLNEVPLERDVQVRLTPIHALPLVANTLTHPSLTVDGRRLEFPVELHSGCYLEWEREAGVASVYGPRGDVLQQTEPIETGDFRLSGGANPVHFECAAAASRPRARITLATKGAPLQA